jgi:hypothetical protein
VKPASKQASHWLLVVSSAGFSQSQSSLQVEAHGGGKHVFVMKTARKMKKTPVFSVANNCPSGINTFSIAQHLCPSF